MNKTQLEYAVRRLDNSHSEKFREIQERNTKKAPKFDAKAFVAAVKSGKLKPYPNCEDIHRHTYISAIFSNVNEVITPTIHPNKKLYDALEAEYTAIKDQLYLGDAKEALALIEAFVAKKF